jgi:hypothetical protein
LNFEHCAGLLSQLSTKAFGGKRPLPLLGAFSVCGHRRLQIGFAVVAKWQFFVIFGFWFWNQKTPETC